MRGRLLLIFVIAVVVLQSVIGAPTKYSQQGGSVVERDTLFFEVQGDPPFTWWQVPAYPEGDFSYETTASNREKLTWTSPPINVQYIHFKIWVKDNSGGTYGFSPRTVYDYLYDRGFGHECLVIDTRSCSGITSAGNIELRANLFADEWVFGDVLTGISLSISGSATVGGLIVSGNIELSKGANRKISIPANSGGGGYDLSIISGEGRTGGDLVLSAGEGTWTDGGDVKITAGEGVSAGGSVYIVPGYGDPYDEYGGDGDVILAHTGSTARGKVGIGTITPAEKLHVNGKIAIGSSGTKKIYAEGDDLVIDLG